MQPIFSPYIFLIQVFPVVKSNSMRVVMFVQQLWWGPAWRWCEDSNRIHLSARTVKNSNKILLASGWNCCYFNGSHFPLADTSINHTIMKKSCALFCSMFCSFLMVLLILTLSCKQIYPLLCSLSLSLCMYLRGSLSCNDASRCF